MPSYSEQTIEDIRSRIDIADLVSSKIPLRRAGADFKACCPFHHEKTPSFIVSPSRGTFHCFGCGAHGDVFKFLMLSDGMTFPDAVKALAEKAGITLETKNDPAAGKFRRFIEIHREISLFFNRCLNMISEAQAAREYLARRKLGGETAERYLLGYVPSKNGVIEKWASKYGYHPDELVECGLLAPPRRTGEEYYNKFHGRIVFPIRDAQGRVVAFSGRILEEKAHAPKYYNSPETPIFKKSRILYGLDEAKKAITRSGTREVLVCEGQIDVIRCHISGFGNAVASQGTAFTADHVSLLKPYADSALLLFDGDGAGIKASVRTGRLFLEAGIPANVAVLPKGEDPDSIILKGGAVALEEVLSKPKSLTAYQIEAFRATESDPDSAVAVSRLAGELFESFASCSKSVMRTKLMQEAASLLSIPFEDLKSDYEAFLSKRRTHSTAKTSPAREAGREEAQEPDNPPEEDKPGNNAPGEPRHDNPPPPQKGWRWRESPILSVAEYLVKTSTSPTEENLGISAFIRKWLPVAVLGEGAAPRIILAALADLDDGGDRLGGISRSGEQEDSALVSLLARRPSPLFASSMPMQEIIEETVAAAWVDYLKLLKDNTPDEEIRMKLTLSSDIRKIQSARGWEKKESVLGGYLLKMIE